MIPDIPTDPVVALQLLVTLLIIPGLVWALAHTKLSGDGKRLVVIVVSVVIGVIHAILTQALTASTTPKTLLEWLTTIVMLAAIVVVYSQAWYLLLKGKIDTGDDEHPERAQL